MNSKIFTFSLLFCLQFFFSQEKINISVHNSQNNGIPGAIVTLSDNENNILFYKETDANGKVDFHNKEGKNLNISVSKLGYEKHVEKNLKAEQKISILLSEKTNQINEIIIKNTKYKDTVAVKTDHPSITEKSSLRDALNKAEGFIVTKEGGISYNGVPITKILVNKREVFVNQNKIALDNINMEAIEKIQMVNNYRDGFKVDFDNFTASVLNINTKSNYKGILKKSLQGLYGAKNAYLIKGSAMYFSDNINAFFTTNTNNVGEKDINTDKLDGIFSLSGNILGESINQYYISDNLVKKDENSNNNLILRKQWKYSRLNFSAEYNYLNWEKNTLQRSYYAENKEPIRDLDNSTTNQGNYLNSKIMYDIKLSEKSILSIENSIINNHMKNFLSGDLTTNSVLYRDEARIIPNTFAINNKISYGGLISDKILVSGSTSYFYEKSSSNFSSYLNTGIRNNQSLRQFNHVFDFDANINYKHSNLLTFYLFSEVKSVDNALFSDDKKYQREYTVSDIYPGIRGKDKKWEYSLAVGQRNFSFRNQSDKNNTDLMISGNMTFRLSGGANLILDIDKSNRVEDLVKGVDTLYTSLATVNTGNIDSQYNISKNFKIKLGYYLSNIARSKSFNIDYSFVESRNIIQPVFTNFDGITTYYRNIIIDHVYKNNFNVSWRKGYYFSAENRKVDFTTKFSYNRSDFPINNTSDKYNSNTYTISLQTSLNLKSRIFNDISIAYHKNIQDININRNNVNSFTVNSFFLDVKSVIGKFENLLSASYSYSPAEGINYNTPNLDLLSSYKYSDKISFFLRGKALFDLLSSNNKTKDLNVYSDGNIITETINPYRMKYLMAGVEYKF
ncbi:TonB-dependent receptor [Chryseobacterium sp. MYb328]|uniref:TonB-dependent receptor n=1 Tax=Chryseobacterium sp. MYb328 TaxID=2745231 RepID=UPI003098DAC4